MKKAFLFLIIVSFAIFTFLAANNSYSYERISTAENNRKPNVVLVTFESTRADHIGPCYGHDRNTATEVCGLEESGILFENAFSPSSWTLPSLTAMRTSSHPSEHQLSIQPGETNLSEGETTIAEKLGQEGYKTIGIGNAPFFHSEYDMDRGFDYFNSSNINSREQVDLAIRKIEQTDKPFYLWIHIFDPHQPYTPPEETKDIFAGNQSSNISADQIGREFASYNLSGDDIDYIKSRYDEEIRFTDNSVGKLIDEMKEKEIFDNSLIFISSDHGEDFTEQDPNLVGHGRHLYNVNTHIPLIMKLPNNQFSNSRVQQPVSLIDIHPTINELILGEASGKTGQSLVKTYKSGERKGVISQMYGSTALVKNSFKYMTGWSRIKLNSQGQNVLKNSSYEELYNLDKDSEEQNNLINNNTGKGEELREVLKERNLLPERFNSSN